MTEDRTPDFRVRYNRNRKKDGNPITVWDMKNGTEWFTDYFHQSDCDVVVKFGNAIAQEKACGATSIMEVFKNKKPDIKPDCFVDDCIEYKAVTNNKEYEYNCCSGCAYKFKIGDVRHHWRLRQTKNNAGVYHSAGFWTVNCIDCMRENISAYINHLPKLLEKLGG